MLPMIITIAGAKSPVGLQCGIPTAGRTMPPSTVTCPIMSQMHNHALDRPPHWPTWDSGVPTLVFILLCWWHLLTLPSLYCSMAQGSGFSQSHSGSWLYSSVCPYDTMIGLTVLCSITPLWHCWLILSSSNLSWNHNTEPYPDLDLFQLLSCIFVLLCFLVSFMNNRVLLLSLIVSIVFLSLMFRIPWL